MSKSMRRSSSTRNRIHEGSAYKPIAKNDHHLSTKPFKYDETPSDNEGEKFERLETENIAGEISNPMVQEILRPQT